MPRETNDLRAMMVDVERRMAQPGAASFIARLRRGPPWLSSLPPHERQTVRVIRDGLVELAETCLGVGFATAPPPDATN